VLKLGLIVNFFFSITSLMLNYSDLIDCMVPYESYVIAFIFVYDIKKLQYQKIIKIGAFAYFLAITKVFLTDNSLIFHVFKKFSKIY